MRRILLLLALALPLVSLPAAANVTFKFVCQPDTTCDGDAGLSFTITLADSVVVANSFYTATAASHADFLGWTAASGSANDSGIPNYNGFSTSGGWNQISSVDAAGLRFYFDANASLTGLQGITEGLPGATNGSVFSFIGTAGTAGEIELIEHVVSGVVTGNIINFRRDRSPTCSGGSTGCPSLPTDNTDIAGVFVRVAEEAPGVPEPGTLALLGLGLAGLAASRRRTQ